MDVWPPREDWQQARMDLAAQRPNAPPRIAVRGRGMYTGGDQSRAWTARGAARSGVVRTGTRVRWRRRHGENGRDECADVISACFPDATRVQFPASGDPFRRAASARGTALPLVAIVVAYAVTTADFPLGYDLVEHFAPGPTIFGLPLRPIFMLLRPFGALLVWLVFGWLVLKGSQKARTHKAGADNAHVHAPPALTPRRLSVVLVGLLGAMVLVRGAIVAVMVLYGAAYSPTALLR